MNRNTLALLLLLAQVTHASQAPFQAIIKHTGNDVSREFTIQSNDKEDFNKQLQTEIDKGIYDENSIGNMKALIANNGETCRGIITFSEAPTSSFMFPHYGKIGAAAAAVGAGYYLYQHPDKANTLLQSLSHTVSTWYEKVMSYFNK